MVTPKQRAVEIQLAAVVSREEVSRMHDLEGLSFGQIGVRLGISRARAWALYHHQDVEARDGARNRNDA